MAAKTQPHALSSLLLLALSTLSFIISYSSNTAYCADISVYWGQYSEREEGSLRQACDSRNYNIVIIASLTVYDDGRSPTLNLANHCGTTSNPCSYLESTIKHCQTNGVKVFLSIGSDVESSPPPEDVDITKDLANQLSNSFLSGNFGPLGAVSLDGIDIQSVADSKHLRWDRLVRFLNVSTTQRRIYISASPRCVYPDAFLDAAIQTGYVDYVWVQFYNSNPCIYSNGNADNLLNAWDTWTTNFPRSTIFLGLTANQNMLGYIEPGKLKTQVLPVAKSASNYGGVMIWDRNSDRKIDYSGKIRGAVLKACSCVSDEPASTGFDISMLASKVLTN